MKRTDWTLMALNAAGPDGLSPVQLQKTLFILSKQLPDAVGDSFYNFVPYNYGPFDRAVYEDAEELARGGQIEITQRDGENWNRYVITREGEVDISRAVYEHRDAADYLERLVKWVQEQTFQGLVSAVYAKYPEMRANSVFQG